MSGRVRWAHALYGRGRASTDVSELRGHGADGEAFQIVRGRCAGPWFATHYGRDAGSDDERTFRRRSDAKRWLLARAAGLAEVPRGPKLRRGVRRIPRGGCALYIGGRLFAVVDHVTIETETDERNRRRR